MRIVKFSDLALVVFKERCTMIRAGGGQNTVLGSLGSNTLSGGAHDDSLNGREGHVVPVLDQGNGVFPLQDVTANHLEKSNPRF